MATPAEEPSALHTNNESTEDGELVSEFPPPPYYYTLALSLTPPLIPHEALERASMKAVEEMNKKKEEAERNRLAAEGVGDGAGNGAGGGIANNGEFLGGDAPDFEQGIEDNDKDDEVAVFGEYVEDPLLAPEDDISDPKIVRDEISRLNKEIIQGFVKLVRDLVNRPVENKKSRDELSHNIFLMLQECNKFREHQAREIFIETLETQLKDRQKALDVLKEEIEKTDNALEQFEQLNNKNEANCTSTS